MMRTSQNRQTKTAMGRTMDRPLLSMLIYALQAVMALGGIAGCNAVSGKQGVIDVQSSRTVEGRIQSNVTAEQIKAALVELQNEQRQSVATSQPVAAEQGGVHVGGTGVSQQTLNVATSQPASATVGGVHVGGGIKKIENVGTDPWLYRGTVWGAIAGSFLTSAWFARWQARRHGYEAGRRKRLGCGNEM